MVLSWSRSCGQAHPLLGTQRGHRENCEFPRVTLQGLPGTYRHCPTPAQRLRCTHLKVFEVTQQLLWYEETRQGHLCHASTAAKAASSLLLCLDSSEATAGRTRWDPGAGAAWRAMHNAVLHSHPQPLSLYSQAAFQQCTATPSNNFILQLLS